MKAIEAAATAAENQSITTADVLGWIPEYKTALPINSWIAAFKRALPEPARDRFADLEWRKEKF